MSERNAGYILLTFKAHQEDGQYVSECVELETASCGDTIQEAFDNLLEATQLYLTTLADEGECDRVFEERGIRVVPGAPPSDGLEVAVRARPNEYVSPHTIRIPAGVS